MLCSRCNREVVLWKDIRLNSKKEIVCTLCGQATFLTGGAVASEDDKKLNKKIIKELLTESDLEE